MMLSPDGRRLIQEFEGLSLTAYPDPRLPKVDGRWSPKQRWSIGYGHQLPAGQVWEGYTITREQAERWFSDDARSRELDVSLLAPIATQSQFDALVSLAYNIGVGDLTTRTRGLAGSTALRLHNAGDYQGAADAFRLWKKSAGADDPVLIKRREKERAIYLGGYGYGTGPAPSPAPLPAPVASPSPSPSPSPVASIAWTVPPELAVPAVGATAGLVAAAGLGLFFFLRKGTRAA